MKRKYPLAVGGYYHVMAKSIAGYQIFNHQADYARFTKMLDFFCYADTRIKFSEFIKRITRFSLSFEKELPKAIENQTKRIRLIAFCIMPTHIHFLAEEVLQDGIRKFMADLQNSYAKYFNLKHKRQGPLWSGTFKNIPVETDSQLLHLTRYIHLNPVTARLVENPADWDMSSYTEYVAQSHAARCDFKNQILLSPDSYSKFVLDRIGYQRELAKIKALLLEDPE